MTTETFHFLTGHPFRLEVERYAFPERVENATETEIGLFGFVECQDDEIIIVTGTGCHHTTRPTTKTILISSDSSLKLV